jgi:hypothetical protein
MSQDPAGTGPAAAARPGPDGLPASHRIAVDWLRPGPLAPDELAAMRRWYAEHHGDGNLDQARFLTFWLDHDSAVAKHYRRFVQSAVSGVPNTVTALVVMHAYAVLGWESGAQYELIAALKYGASRDQALEALALAFIHAGPMGMGRVAQACDAYLSRWDGKADQPPAWPAGWAPDPARLKSGIDLSRPGLSEAERQLVLDWYTQNQGEVPDHIHFLARWNPDGLKAFRNRLESCIQTLPVQVVPLMLFLVAALRGEAAAMRRAAFQARHYGVRRAHLLPFLSIALVYAGDIGGERITAAVSPLLDDWPE